MVAFVRRMRLLEQSHERQQMIMDHPVQPPRDTP
jgi:hypothetical protein